MSKESVSLHSVDSSQLMLTVTVYPVDLSVGSAGSDHLCGPDHHHAGAEDTQGSPPSPGCVPLRWYQGKNQLNSLDLHPSDQTENYCSIVKTKRTCSWLVLEMLWFVSSWLCLNISINLQYFTVHHPWWCWTSALTSSYESNIHHLIIQATWVLLCHFSCDVSISRCSHKMLSWWRKICFSSLEYHTISHFACFTMHF